MKDLTIYCTHMVGDVKRRVVAFRNLRQNTFMPEHVHTVYTKVTQKYQKNYKHHMF